ncbi:uncharacterized protein PHALS_14826 [Plasmopara halstedii]|uniref:Transmembrane protein n=1 Tax=Plasmopara halstedii TaxID=4781 RepID=A0A0P1AWR1_PLAHL|nr:uncharacterized protein PHALS_14826 [Plasmopara halstedii]CEG45608.1 hypothetical protein PHALS_14826 [Plasmopara halstedii]|eukprot:XP_024581977.1 hypothetical protein PHALS_14826 [Plasmopara halstedii]
MGATRTPYMFSRSSLQRCSRRILRRVAKWSRQQHRYAADSEMDHYLCLLPDMADLFFSMLNAFLFSMLSAFGFSILAAFLLSILRVHFLSTLLGFGFFTLGTRRFSFRISRVRPRRDAKSTFLANFDANGTSSDDAVDFHLMGGRTAALSCSPLFFLFVGLLAGLTDRVSFFGLDGNDGGKIFFLIGDLFCFVGRLQ